MTTTMQAGTATGRMWRAGLAGLLLTLVTIIGVAAAAEATYPQRPIQLVIPFGPGGATDVLFRALARHAEPLLGVPIEPVNIPGASATRGSQAVLKAAPDGYTLLGSHQALDLTYLAGVASYSHRDFAPVARLMRTINIPATHSAHPVQSAREIAPWVREAPEGRRFGLIPYATPHFFWLQFFELADIDPTQVTLVHYPDTASQIAALLAREIDFAMLNLPSAGPLFASGVLRPLGVAHHERLAALPETPTLTEQGIALINATERGLFAPKGTPPERLETLAEAFRGALATPELAARVEHEYGSLVRFLPPDDYAAHLEAQLQQLEALAKRLDFRPQGPPG